MVLAAMDETISVCPMTMLSWNFIALQTFTKAFSQWGKDSVKAE